jgi:hypothetical protein
MLQQPDRYRQTKFFLCYLLLNLFVLPLAIPSKRKRKKKKKKEKENMMAKWGKLCS